MAPFEESEGPSSLEADSGSFDAAKDSQSKASVDRKQRNGDEVHEEKQKQKNTEEVKGTQKTQSKGDKHIHYVSWCFLSLQSFVTSSRKTWLMEGQKEQTDQTTHVLRGV